MSAFINKTVLKNYLENMLLHTIFFKTSPLRTGFFNLFVQFLETDFDNGIDNIFADNLTPLNKTSL